MSWVVTWYVRLIHIIFVFFLQGPSLVAGFKKTSILQLDLKARLDALLIEVVL